jgi:hypothetical protein
LKRTAPRSLRAITATALATVAAYLVVAAVFSRIEWADTVAYGLPGANLARAGSLTVPQLGTQFSFDRFWLFNAPWVVVGEIPTFWIAGIGRLPHLTGIVAFGLINWVAFTLASRRLFAVQSMATAILIAFAFLDTRGLVTADLYNQKYSVLAYSLLLVAFFPVIDPRSACGRPWWQWLAAGVLPLVHIILPPATIIWVATVCASERRVRGRSLVGPALLVACGVASLIWYLRPAPFETQLWPHLTYGGFRHAGRFSGLLDVAASPVAAIPTWTLAVATVLAALSVTVRASLAIGADDVRSAIPAAALILAILIVDAWRGFLDYGFFIAGVGPIVFAAATPRGRLHEFVALALAIAGAVNIAVSTKLDRLPPDLTSTRDTEAFLIAHTRDTDRIIVAPPFVFAAAALPPVRSIPRIVPQPYFLETFDREAWARDLNACCNVYVGDEEAYTRLTRPGFVGPPIFRTASIEQYTFQGHAILVARRP